MMKRFISCYLILALFVLDSFYLPRALAQNSSALGKVDDKTSQIDSLEFREVDIKKMF